jgi:hypothetical protein
LYVFGWKNNAKLEDKFPGTSNGTRKVGSPIYLERSPIFIF